MILVWHFFSFLLAFKEAKPERPSRWQRSKTWRSPSSPQIHQKYIYMWNNSYRTPTERWQKTSDFPKGNKFPMYLGNRCPQETYTQRRHQIQSWNPGAVQTKKRKGNLSMQPQERRIKSPQSIWCTVHLWNTWVDNVSSKNWGRVDFGSNCRLGVSFLIQFVSPFMFILV